MMLVAALGILLLLSGCAVGPSYKQPTVNLPKNYSLSLESRKINHIVKWWQVFDDPLLQDLIERGLSQNFDVKIALEKIEESRNMNRIAIANIFPQLNFFSGVFRGNPGNGFFDQQCANTQNSKIPNITSSLTGIETLWEIDIWGRLRRTQQAAKYQFLAQIEDMRDVLIIMAAEIAQTYITICSLEKKIAVTEKTVALDREILTLYKDTFSAGLDNKQIPLEQFTTVDLEKTQLIQYQIDQKVNIHKLAYLVGTIPDKLTLNLECVESVPLPEEDLTIDKPYELLRRRPDIRRSEKLLAASYAQIGAAMAEWFPKVSLLAFLTKPTSSSTCSILGTAKIWAVGPLFEWPILDFGRIYFNIKVKESSQRQALLTYQKTVINAVKEVEDWLVSYVQEKNKLTIIEEEYQSEEKKYLLIQDAVRSGIDSKFSLLASQKRLQDIEIALINSQEKVATNFIALFKALGGDW